MKADEFTAWSGGVVAALTAIWAIFKDRMANRTDRAKGDTDRLAIALDGFEGLVDEMRKEIERGQSERADLMHRIAELQVQREADHTDRAALTAEIQNLRLEVSLLRNALTEAGLPLPVLKAVK